MRSAKYKSRVAAIALVASVLVAQQASAQDTMTITGYGGAAQTSQRKAYFEPFSKTEGVKVLEEEWSGETAKLRGMVETGNVTWDVVNVETGHALQGCAEGWLEKIDYGPLGGKGAFQPGAAFECGVGITAYGTVIAYDASKFPNGGPQTLADFWDVKKFPGARSLRRTPWSTLEMALLADGVKREDIYTVLGTPEGVNRAFKKLDEIKPYVKVWWTAGAQPPQLLADGEVTMTTAYNGRIYNAVQESKKDFRIVWDGAALDWDVWAIPKGTKHLDLAKKFLEFALRPENQAEQTKYISYGPSRKEAAKLVDPAMLKNLPTAEENMKTAFNVSPEFWADHGEELTERFNNWIAQ